MSVLDQKELIVRTILAVIVVAAASLAIAGTASTGTTATKLNGTVGPGFTIKLTKGGAKVTSLKAGSYSFTIADKSNIHNFTLQQLSGGKTTKQLTGTGFVGTKTVTVKLAKGKWKYLCTVHPTMQGTFTVK
jgi:plastocyanin